MREREVSSLAAHLRRMSFALILWFTAIVQDGRSQWLWLGRAGRECGGGVSVVLTLAESLERVGVGSVLLHT